jgi:5-methylcytosine-specific restriction protein B
VVAKDNSKYLFNGERYGKGRLVLAVVSAYINKHQPTIKKLRETFSKDLQGSIGVFYTEKELNDRSESSNDKKVRFFTNDEDRLSTDGEQIFICTEWGKGNIELFVEHAIKLGFDIKMDSQVLSDEEIIKQFLHKPAFEKNHQAWSDDVLKSFCDLMRYTHKSGLDIFTTKMKTGDSIRIGRKEKADQNAKEVFATLEPCTNKVNYAQRYKHRDDYLMSELDSDALTELIAVGVISEFNQEHPVTRTPYWPNDYQNGDIDMRDIRIWKVSHSPKSFNDKELNWLAKNNILAVHKNTGNGSADCFKDISKGDIISLGHGNTIFRLARVLTDIEHIQDSPFDDEWLMRRYEIIDSLDKPISYKGKNKRWSPRFNGTSWEVPINEYLMFEEELLLPYYSLSLEDLGFDSSHIIKTKSEDLKMDKSDTTPLNQILYGPPGTGKTYNSIVMAVNAAEPNFLPDGESKDELRAAFKVRYDQLVAEGRVRFVTFHQSYGYEEFVEGLSAKTEGDQLSYFEKDGVFKSICDDAKLFRVAKAGQISDSFDARWQVFSDGLAEAETGVQIETLSKKTFFTITDVTNNTIRFDKSKGNSVHTLSVKTLKAVYNQEKEIKGGLQPYYGALIEHLSHIHVTQAENQVERKHFVLVIDEINRGNISKVFGELITLIEPSKRLGQKESLEVVLPYSGDKFTVPDNLHIIGTMNTADRSLALMDTALRRRFDFVEMMPDYSVLTDDENQPYCINHLENEIDLVQLLSTVNKRISALYDREHTLGHAFLMPVVDKIKSNDHQGALTELANCFQNKLIPLLAEYFFEDWQKIRLVLADNQKPKELQLIKETDVDLADLFGDTDEVDVMDDELNDYQLIKADSELWLEPLTYLGIYQPSALGK